MSGEHALGAAALDEVYRHAEEGYGEEVCGLILRDGSVRRVQNAQNALHAEDPATFPRDARTAYYFPRADLLFLDRHAAEVAAIYHSHVDVGAYFSDEDQRAALFDGEPLYAVDYLVVDAQRDGARGAKLFRHDAGARKFVEVAAFDRAAAKPADAPARG